MRAGAGDVGAEEAPPGWSGRESAAGTSSLGGLIDEAGGQAALLLRLLCWLRLQGRSPCLSAVVVQEAEMAISGEQSAGISVHLAGAVASGAPSTPLRC